MVPDLSNIPKNPGCYFFKDKSNNILYIGKAKDLKKRVSSYFNRPPAQDKTAELIKHIESIEFIVVDTESEALLLEARLIRQNKPPYNIDLKDGERYAYILVTDEPFPRIMTARRRKQKGRWFGPFVDGSHRKALIRTVTLLCQIRTCQSLPKRPCLQYHIGNCTAPCIKKATKESYQAQVDQAIKLLEGKTEVIIAKLMQDMAQASKDLRFERAKELRDHLEALSRRADRQNVDRQARRDQDIIVSVQDETKKLIQVFHVKRGVLLGKKEFKLEKDADMSEFLMQFYTATEIPDEIVLEDIPEDAIAIQSALEKINQSPVRILTPSKGASKDLLDLARKNALIQLKKGDIGLADLQDILKLPHYPAVIECFDISHLSGKQTVASMVSLIDGKPRKSEYRRFKIKTVDKIDDFASMKEVVARRYSRLNAESKPLPNLIVIDGGAGQLNAARSALKDLNLEIPIIGLAKRLEEIYLPFHESPILLDSKRESIKVLQRARDEAHRFAITYHRLLRKKAQGM